MIFIWHWPEKVLDVKKRHVVEYPKVVCVSCARGRTGILNRTRDREQGDKTMRNTVLFVLALSMACLALPDVCGGA